MLENRFSESKAIPHFTVLLHHIRIWLVILKITRGSQVYTYFLFKEKQMKLELMMFQWVAMLVAYMKKMAEACQL